jgi:N,N'-diacetylchitobiose transport system substrate-binding protein
VKFTKTAATAAVIAIAVAGCGSSSGSKSATTSSSKAPAKITAWVMGAQNAPEDKVLAQAKADFQVTYPKTAVEIDYVPWPDATKKLQNALTTGQGPDVVEIGNDQAPGWIAQGALADISSEFKSWGDAKSLSATAVQMAQQNGKQYAVPWYAGVRVLWYRKDLLAKSHLQPPKTWTDLQNDAKTIQTASNGKVDGVAAPNDFTNGFASFLWSAGGEIATQQGGKWAAQLDTPQAKQAIQYYTGLVKSGVAPKRYVGTNELNGPQTDFANGKVGFYIDGGWALPQIKTINPKYVSDMAVTTIPTPSGQLGPAFAGGSDLAVWRTSKNPKVAFAFATSVASKKNAKAFADSLDFFPDFTDLSSPSNYSSDPIQSVAAQQMGDTKSTPLTANWVQADSNDKIIPTMLKNIMNGADLNSEVAKANTQLTNVLNQSS